MVDGGVFDTSNEVGRKVHVELLFLFHCYDASILSGEA